ncbi:MAG: alpha/beta hydrolase [Euryarchaeota archaeon]|nr:alpha/beta hydrolase [Euryarchaeota archaeon]
MGLGGGKESWFLQTRAFSRQYTVITFDNRGVGQTKTGHQQPFTIETMADDAIALLDHLGVDKAHILGYSLGGIVAQEIAIRYPARVNKLILGSTMANGPGQDMYVTGVRQALGLKAGTAELGRDEMKKAMPVLTEMSFNKWMYRALFGLGAKYAYRSGSEGLAGQFNAPAGANTLDRLNRIQATTLVLAGTKDRVIDPSASELLASRIPHAKLVLVEGGSHSFYIEMRGQFNREVLSFLGES